MKKKWFNTSCAFLWLTECLSQIMNVNNLYVFIVFFCLNTLVSFFAERKTPLIECNAMQVARLN